VHGAEPPPRAIEVADQATDLFTYYAKQVWERAREVGTEPTAVLSAAGGFFASYRVLCSRLYEQLGLLALADTDLRDEVASWLDEFIKQNPGASQPISDRWAVSLIPATLVRAVQSPDNVIQHLAGVASWVCDFYEGEGLGLAPADADPAQEVDYLLGGAFEHVEQPMRAFSYLATVILDLAAALSFDRLYDDARNDFLAVDVGLQVPLARDDDAQYQVGQADIPVDTSPNYAETWADASGGRVAAHHDDETDRYYLGRMGRVWDHLAITTVTRDLHWVASWPPLMAAENAD
jgi:hypothetical protein